eukprot:5766846-Pyramimonas_sp.AAC.1
MPSSLQPLVQSSRDRSNGQSNHDGGRNRGGAICTYIARSASVSGSYMIHGGPICMHFEKSLMACGSGRPPLLLPLSPNALPHPLRGAETRGVLAGPWSAGLSLVPMGLAPPQGSAPL